MVTEETSEYEDESTDTDDPIFKIEEVSSVNCSGKQLFAKLKFSNETQQYVTSWNAS